VWGNVILFWWDSSLFKGQFFFLAQQWKIDTLSKKKSWICDKFSLNVKTKYELLYRTVIQNESIKDHLMKKINKQFMIIFVKAQKPPTITNQ